MQEYHKVFVNSRHRKIQAGRYTFPVNGDFDHKKNKTIHQNSYFINPFL